MYRRGRLDGNDVESERSARHRRPIGEAIELAEAGQGAPEREPLAAVERLLGESVVPAGSPANLDRDELGRRAGVDGDEVDLVVPEADVPSQDRPAQRGKAVRNRDLGERACGARFMCVSFLRG